MSNFIITTTTFRVLHKYGFKAIHQVRTLMELNEASEPMTAQDILDLGYSSMSSNRGTITIGEACGFIEYAGNRRTTHLDSKTYKITALGKKVIETLYDK